MDKTWGSNYLLQLMLIIYLRNLAIQVTRAAADLIYGDLSHVGVIYVGSNLPHGDYLPIYRMATWNTAAELSPNKDSLLTLPFRRYLIKGKIKNKIPHSSHRLHIELLISNILSVLMTWLLIPLNFLNILSILALSILSGIIKS